MHKMFFYMMIEKHGILFLFDKSITYCSDFKKNTILPSFLQSKKRIR